MNTKQRKQASFAIQRASIKRLAVLAALAISSSVYIAPTHAQAPAAQDGTAMSGDMKSGSVDMPGMMKAMHEKMSAMQPTGNTDVDFATMMRVHHQSAVTMAEAELRDGKDQQMRAMAKKIITSQNKEIAEFDRFVAKQSPTPSVMTK